MGARKPMEHNKIATTTRKPMVHNKIATTTRKPGQDYLYFREINLI